MRLLNTVQRVLLWLLLIPVVAVCLDALLRMLGAQEENPIVSAVHGIANFFILDMFTDVFPDQSELRTAVVALVAYGLIALLIVGIFRALRTIVSVAPPSRPGPARTPREENAERTRPPEPSDGAPKDQPVEPTGASDTDSSA